MREIKFRAWDKGRKEYLPSGQILISIEPGKRPEKSNIYLDILKDANKYNDRFIIEQYTGLHDKNGKEIYEGDIVTVDEYYFYDPTGIIKWCKDTARFIIDFDNECIIWDFDDTYSYELEVVGNIFDNPELLESGE